MRQVLKLVYFVLRCLALNPILFLYKRVWTLLGVTLSVCWVSASTWIS